MSFLRRLLGGSGSDSEPAEESSTDKAVGPAERPGDSTTDDEDERKRDRELLRAEAQRLDDDLIQRQLRYADRSWVPPREGGEERAGEVVQ